MPKPNRPTLEARGFQGLNLIEDPARLELSWLREADNIDIDNTGLVTRRSGYAELIADGVTDGYSMRHGRRLFVLRNQDLIEIHADESQTVLGNVGLDTAAWTEAGHLVFLRQKDGLGATGWVITPTGLTKWGAPVPEAPRLGVMAGNLPPGEYRVTATHISDQGLESGALEVSTQIIAQGEGLRIEMPDPPAGYRHRVYITEPNGVSFYALATDVSPILYLDPAVLSQPLRTWGFFPPPIGRLTTFHEGKIYIAAYDGSLDQSFIFPSQPLGYHWFDLANDALAIQGRITVLEGATGGLLIGTDSEIFGLVPADGGDILTRLAHYGAIEGSAARTPQGRVVFWTDRGAAAFPFELLTEDRARPDLLPGAAIVLDDGGNQRFLFSSRG